MHYEWDNYKSVYEPMDKSKLDGIIDKELAEGYGKPNGQKMKNSDFQEKHCFSL